MKPPKPKRTACDYALWAALPMAQTSQVESRLTMILDKSQSRRVLTGRVLFAALGLSIVSVVSLAMLRPAAKAQVALVRPDNVQLLGVQDIGIHHTDHRWWDAKGKILVGRVDAGIPSRTATDLFHNSNDKNLRFAVRLPDAIQGQNVTFAASDSFFPKEIAPPDGSRNNARSLYTSFSGSIKMTTLSVGVGAGPWTEVVDCPKTAGKVRLKRPSGEVIFALIANLHGANAAQEIYDACGLTSAQAAPGDVVLIVSDHFHNPSPLKMDKMATMVSSYSSRTRSGEAVQKIQHDAENCERVVYCLDKSGQVITKLTGTMNLNLENEENDRFKMDQLFVIPPSLLKHIAAFRLVARPYQWTEFKNVALEPVK
jgi:hypothetical protein